MAVYRIKGTVELLPQEGGWYYVPVPLWITEELGAFADRGLIAVTAAVGATTWKTSLMPMGDGSHFLALNARVRHRGHLDVGDSVEVSFELRGR